METFQAYITLIKDIVTILATTSAAIVAVIGLQTWKKQLTANAEYNLAKRILIQVYKVRDTINSCRIRVTSLEDVENVERIEKLLDAKDFSKLTDGITNMEVESLEVEATWGRESDCYQAIYDFLSLSAELQMAYYFSRPKFACRQERTENSPLLYFVKDNGSDFRKKTDRFSEEVEATIGRIERALRPKLTLKRLHSYAKW